MNERFQMIRTISWLMIMLVIATCCDAYPIETKFHLESPGFVTLVIEDPLGHRVRNLVGEGPLSSGDHVVSWDGLDDITPDANAASHSVYHIPGKLVQPGRYVVRGLVRPELKILYETTPYTHGAPPWQTKDPASLWIANHSPPSAALFIPAGNGPLRTGKPSSAGPQILIGSYVTEGGSGIAWLDENGTKLYGQTWLGGIWAAATHLARDLGPNPVKGIYAYAAAPWENELRLTELFKPDGSSGPTDSRQGSGGDRSLLVPSYKFPVGSRFTDLEGDGKGLGGLAIYNGVLVASLPAFDQLLFVDARTKTVLGHVHVDDPRGVAFSVQGELFVLSGRRVLKFAPSLQAGPPSLPVDAPSLVIERGLEDPQQIMLNGKNIFISDWGNSHQVKIFSSRGVFQHAIGMPGAPAVGPYNPNHMNCPYGLTIDSKDHLWVAEKNKAPKRISVWTTEAPFLKTFYGPSQYGGGGTIDSENPTRFFYGDDGGGQEFKLDYERGESVPTAVYFRPELYPWLASPTQSSVPQTPFHVNGKTYLTDAYTSSPTNGISNVSVWVLEKGVARPTTIFGQVQDAPLFGFNRPFSVRWTGDLVPKFGETYTLALDANENAMMIIDGQMIDARGNSKKRDIQIKLEAGKCYPIRG